VQYLGDILVDPLYDGTLGAEIDLDEIKRSQVGFDLTGHYARPVC
jgi:hypothetical protein